MANRNQDSDDLNGSTLYARATAAEHARQFDAAFQLYVSAAQSFLRLAKNLPATRAAERTKAKDDAGTCLARAERIKDVRKGALKPLARDPFSKDEQTYILDKSSRVNGISFPVWSRSNTLSYVGEATREQPPLGDNLLSLSPNWRRPSEVYRSGKFSLAGPHLHPQHVRQSIITDCSVCSAAAICVHHHRSFDSKLGLSSIFPQDANGLPTISSDNIYRFRFFLNGTFRKISIDDRLPFTSDGRPLSAMAILDGGDIDIFPALLEKAYMKLMGGYDFPGSNSSVDLHALTGWIPEHIEIKSSKFVREKVFARIQEGFKRGSCVLTLGTGSRGIDSPILLPGRGGSPTKLLPTHSYAVLDVNGEFDDRWMTLLNPWTVSPNEEGLSTISQRIGTLRIGGAVNTTDFDDDADDPSRAEGGLASLIRVAWEDVCSAFDGLFLNWDRSLFRHTIEFHGSWREKAESNLPGCAHHYLTIDIIPGPDGARANFSRDHEMWILLTRHVVDKLRSGEFIAIHAVQIEREDSSLDTTGSDIGVDPKGSYTNSTHTLTRLLLNGLPARVALVASYDGPYTGVCFTVQAFSECAQLAWVSQPRVAGYECLIEGTFSSRNAGGNSTYPTFMNNPQYRLKLHSDKVAGQEVAYESKRKSPIRIVVEGPRDTPLNLLLTWRSEEDSKERVFQLRPGDTIASSGPYSYGVAQLTNSVAPGDYCIVVSTFEPRHRGNYTLRIESAVRMDLEDIPPEGAGMFCRTYKGAWRPGADGGSPRFGSYEKNPMFEVDVRSATDLKLRLQLTKPSASVALNVTLFALSAYRSTSYAPSSSNPSSSEPFLATGYSLPHDASVSLDRQITTSGAYVDGARSPAGAVTPQTRLPPGKYVAVVSTFDPGIHAAFQLLVFSKSDVKVSSIYQ